MEKSRDSKLHFLIFLLLYALLFDSVFRKWIFPEYSAGIMLVKFGIIVLIFLYGLKYIKQLTVWEIASIIIGICVFLLTLATGHANPWVDLWGCMPLLFGIPACFFMGRVLTRKDLIKIGKILVYVSIINSILLIVQFNEPITSILNYQGGDLDERIEELSIAELSGAFRPSGLFQHNSHNTMFSALAFTYILYFLSCRKKILNKYILLVALVLDVVSCICSVSRTNIFYHVGIAAYFFFMTSTSKLLVVFRRSLIIVPLAFFLYTSPFVNKALENMEKRFEIARDSQFEDQTVTEGTISDIYDRSVEYNINAFISPKTFDGEEVPFFGFGQGMSTQFGGRMLGLQDHAGFSLAEFDGLRIMCESGLLFGWLIIFIRLGYFARFATSIPRYKRERKQLAILLFPNFALFFFLMTNWGNIFLSCIAFLTAAMFITAANQRNL